MINMDTGQHFFSRKTLCHHQEHRIANELLLKLKKGKNYTFYKSISF